MAAVNNNAPLPVYKIEDVPELPHLEFYNNNFYSAHLYEIATNPYKYFAAIYRHKFDRKEYSHVEGDLSNTCFYVDEDFSYTYVDCGNNNIKPFFKRNKGKNDNSLIEHMVSNIYCIYTNIIFALYDSIVSQKGIAKNMLVTTGYFWTVRRYKKRYNVKNLTSKRILEIFLHEHPEHLDNFLDVYYKLAGEERPLDEGLTKSDLHQVTGGSKKPKSKTTKTTKSKTTKSKSTKTKTIKTKTKTKTTKTDYSSKTVAQLRALVKKKGKTVTKRDGSGYNTKAQLIAKLRR